VPATGQESCFDGPGNVIDCGSTDYPGQDGFYRAGCPTEGRYVDNGDGTVTDACTGLMWQKDTADASGDGSIGPEDGLTWQDALNYCDGLTFAGYDDWRLPSISELLSIVDYGRFSPAIDPVFRGVPEWYWSSTTGILDPDFAWDVYLWGGISNGGDKHNRLYVRAVRTVP